MTDPGTHAYIQYLRGDDRGLEELVAIFSDMLVRFACRITNDPAAAEDIAEDAFVALISKRKYFGNDAALRAYLFRTVRNKCYDHLRFRRRLVALDENLISDALQELERREHSRMLYTALAALHGPYRDAVYLVYLEGFSVEECAAILKRTKKQVYNLLARGKTALKEQLEKEGYSHEDLP